MSRVEDCHPEGRRLDPSVYRAIFEHSLDGVMFTAPDGRIFAANEAACVLLRMSEDEIIAAGRHGLMDPTDPEWNDAVDQRRRDGKMRAKLRMRRGDGMFILADVTSVIFEVDGEPRACVIVRDASDLMPVGRPQRAATDMPPDGTLRRQPLTEVLTARERVVLTYLGTQMTYREMAAELFISTNTLKSHLKAIYRKLDADSRSEAVAKARAAARPA